MAVRPHPAATLPSSSQILFPRRHHESTFGTVKTPGDAVPGGARRNIGDSDDEHIAGLHQIATSTAAVAVMYESALYIPLFCHNDFSGPVTNARISGGVLLTGHWMVVICVTRTLHQTAVINAPPRY
ncbi:hypothetical protein KCP75_01590 [Salmonella enterica subsp. enterica]|nr:hypothetical protein KCP75_01590 [Salmonella enterica subsp. enterica]